MKLRTEDVVFDAELYPRLDGHNAELIRKYAQAISYLPPIEVNQSNVLIDGWHRWQAHKVTGQEFIEATVTETQSNDEIIEIAVSRNASHGNQLSNSEKRKWAIKWFEATPIENRAGKKSYIAEKLKVTDRTVHSWVEDIEAKSRSEMESLIMSLWLKCYTQEEIAEKTGRAQSRISVVLSEIEKLQIAIKPSDFDDIKDEEEKQATIIEANKKACNFLEEDWKPPIYNIWSYGKKTNAVTHFGNTEQRIVENLLWLYTKPFDIVVDPFAGGGSTMDVCLSRLRRCWCGDRKPIEARLQDIKQHDICDGLPRLQWESVSLVYLDPPYWRQAQGRYSEDKEDLANMPLDEFTEKLSSVVVSLTKKLRPESVIAMIISPTQWASEPRGKFNDHMFEIISAVGNKRVEVENRISCPYSTEQYYAEMVNWAKENKKPLVLTRELVIWRVL